LLVRESAENGRAPHRDALLAIQPTGMRSLLLDPYRWHFKE
jgi:hypothetical protein